MVEFLLQRKIKALVVACNTATAFTLPDLREKLDIPVIGVIKPGARAAINSTRNQRVGVIGTEGTIQSDAYRKTLVAINPDLRVNSLACPSFVPMVEQGILSGDHAQKIVKESLQPMKKSNHIDTLILGCTHYPLIKDTIQEVIGKHVTIVSSSEETARETSTILDINELLYKGDRLPHHEFNMTGDIEAFTKISKRIFKDATDYLYKITSEKVVID